MDPYNTSTYNEENPLTEQEMNRLMGLLADLTTGQHGGLEWSASYHGVTEVPRRNTEAENVACHRARYR